MGQRYLFKQACVIGKTEYANNKVQEVPEEDLTHPYFQQLMKAGKIVEPSGSAQILPESATERGQRLADKLLKDAADKVAEKAPEVKDEEPKKEEEPPTEDQKSDDDEHEEKKSGKAKNLKKNSKNGK